MVRKPSIRLTRIGIAVSSATDVAKGAASVVLTEPGLTNIVALVEQGRTIDAVKVVMIRWRTMRPASADTLS
jgi:cation transport ATPase